MDEVKNVENFFKSHQVYLSPVWLQSCINWCKNENLPPNYTLKDLQYCVFDQWLLLDLRDVEIPCLPPNLSSKQNYILSDNYTLQLMYIVDISKPKYWQLQRIRSSVPKNLEQEFESSKRVLKLTLTDGVQEVEATEYKTIKCLHLNLSPGIKIRLMGPIQVRRGRLMLEENNVKVVGGEVDTLLVSNAAENILAKDLNQPLNPKPAIIQESILTANKDMFNETGASSVTVYNNNTQNSLNNAISNRNINIVPNSYRNPKNESTPKNTTIQSQFPNLGDFDDDFKIDEEIDLIMEVEREFEQHNNSKSIKTKTPDMFDDDIDFESIDIPNPVTPHQNSKPVGNTSDVINISDSLEMEDSTIDISNTSTKPCTSNTDRAISASPQPVVWSIDKLLKTMPNITNGKFKIKAKFSKIIEKMTVKEYSFHLVVDVEDASGVITLNFHCDVVAELIGYSVEEFMRLRDEWSKDNVEAKTKILRALECLKNHLTDLDNVLVVQISAKDSLPTLIKIL